MHSDFSGYPNKSTNDKRYAEKITNDSYSLTKLDTRQDASVFIGLDDHLNLYGCQPTRAWEIVFVYINFYSGRDRNQSESTG